MSVNVLLLGTGGSGKSSIGNALLRRQAFDVSTGMMASDSAGFQSGSEQFPGESMTCLTVVDSPDLTLDLDGTIGEKVTAVRASLEDAFKQCPREEFHLVVLTVRLDMRFTEEKRQCLSCIADALGPCLTRLGVVAFTHGDCLGNDEEKLRAAVERTRQDEGDIRGVGSLIDRCGGRFCFVDGSRRSDKGLQQSQVRKLLDFVETARVKPLIWAEVGVWTTGDAIPVRKSFSRYLWAGVVIAVAGIAYKYLEHRFTTINGIFDFLDWLASAGRRA